MSASYPMVAPSERLAAKAVTALAVVSLVWIGFALGVSFFATPVKFLAPSLSLPVALDVGRQTFFWFSRVELALAFVSLAGAAAYELGAAGDRSAAARVPVLTLLCAALVAAVAAQMAWLLPALDARVEVILAGGMPPPSWLHDAYIVVEALKLGLLVGVAWLAFGRHERRGP